VPFNVFKPWSFSIDLVGRVFLSVFSLKNIEELLNIDQPLQEMGGKEFY